MAIMGQKVTISRSAGCCRVGINFVGSWSIGELCWDKVALRCCIVVISWEYHCVPRLQYAVVKHGEIHASHWRWCLIMSSYHFPRGIFRDQKRSEPASVRKSTLFQILRSFLDGAIWYGQRSLLGMICSHLAKARSMRVPVGSVMSLIVMAWI